MILSEADFHLPPYLVLPTLNDWWIAVRSFRSGQAGFLYGIIFNVTHNIYFSMLLISW